MALHVSASQVETFRLCPRKWYARHVLKEKTPPTRAQERGKKLHTEIEHYLRTGEILPPEYYNKIFDGDEPSKRRALVLLAIDVLPKPGPGLYIEDEFLMDTLPGYPQWLGYKDLVVARQRRLRIIDHKSTSDFRYAKTPQELAENVQLISYAKHTLDVADAFGLPSVDTDSIEIAHFYYRTGSSPKVHIVDTTVTREQVEKVWFKALGTVREMVAWLNGKHEMSDLPPNTDACGMYGGCEYRPKCGLTPLSTLKGRFAMEKNTGGGLMAKLNNFRPRQEVTVVMPPDAPPRDAVPIEITHEEPKRGRGRPRKTVAEIPSAKILQEIEDQTTAVVVTDSTYPVAPAVEVPRLAELYIDCLPVKGCEGDYTMLEDWLAGPLNACALQYEVPDYRMIDLRATGIQAKGALAAAIRDKVKSEVGLPSVIVASSGIPGSDVAFEVLIPYAHKVVRGFKL